MAVATATEHLRGGHDVIAPQYLGRAPFPAELERVASRTGSSSQELVLLDTRQNAVGRFHAGAGERGTRHPPPRGGGHDRADLEPGEMDDRLVALLGAAAARPDPGNDCR
jgi:hypothetical protein